MLLIDFLPLSTLHQFNADAVGRRDIAQQIAAEARLQFDRKLDALGAQFGAKAGEIASIQEPEMIGAEPVMAGKAAIGPDRPGRCRFLTGALAADQDVHAAELDKNLRRAVSDRLARDRRAEHPDIPLRRS